MLANNISLEVKPVVIQVFAVVKSTPSIGAVLIPISPDWSILNEPPPSVAISNIFSSPEPAPRYLTSTPTLPASDSPLKKVKLWLYQD